MTQATDAGGTGSAEAEAATRPAPPASARRPWTLQRRLIITIVAIVSFILVLVAVVTSAVLGSVLESRLDQQVRQTQERAMFLVTQVTGLGVGFSAGDLLEQQKGAAPGLLLVVATATDISGAVIADDGSVRTLTPAQLREVDAALSGPGLETVRIAELGTFRVAGQATPNAVGVVGLSTDEVARTVGEMLIAIALLTAAGLILLVIATAWTVRAGLRPLRAVAETADRVARQPLDRGAVSISERVPPTQADPHTEVGAVGAALNTLLDHVDASLVARQRNEDRMRAFVADASHELRTPLASIRGYSELSLRALAHPGPGTEETTAQSLERIQAQSLRMTGLVEDLLLLARLDEGQELVYGTVDLTRLAVEAVADARAAGPDHVWRIDVGPGDGDVEADAEPVGLAGDASRLHQVVANLLANARTHTPAGSTVTVTVERAGDDAVLRVHDDGPGIDPAVQAELFERFARGDASRARQTGGTGLGLSIARAIVTAHGGTIEVASAPGDTTFTVRLPARSAAP